MIKLRLWGQRHELAEALPVIRDAFNVLQESELYKDRGQSQYWRLYLEVEVKSLEEQEEKDTNETDLCAPTLRVRRLEQEERGLV